MVQMKNKFMDYLCSKLVLSTINVSLEEKRNEEPNLVKQKFENFGENKEDWP